MSFNPGISKRADEIIFSFKRSIVSHPSLTYNSIPVAQTISQEHLGMQLVEKLNFKEHLNKVESKINKTIGKIRQLQNVPPPSTPLTIYKSFIKLHLDYGDIIYDKAFNEFFHAKLELLQYNTSLATTRVVRGSSSEKIYEELDLVPLKSRSWYRKMSFLYKVFKSESPLYFFNTIPNSNTQRQTRKPDNISSFFVKHDDFQN